MSLKACRRVTLVLFTGLAENSEEAGSPMREGGEIRVWPTPALHGAPGNGAGQDSVACPIDAPTGAPLPNESGRRTRHQNSGRDRPENRLPPKTELLNERAVAAEILLLEIVEQTATLAHNLE